MLKYQIANFVGGWYIGNFLPSILRTSEFEVGYHKYTKGQLWPDHTHKIITEIVLVISGEMLINGEKMIAGDLFVLQPNEPSRSEYITDCELIIVKMPSVPGDKYLI